MNSFLAVQSNFWSLPAYSPQLYLASLVVLILGIGLIFVLQQAPTRARRPIVAFFTFISGAFYVMLWIWPTPVDPKDGQIPNNLVEGVGFWLHDAVPRVSDLSQILTSLLLGLGIFSLVKIHSSKLLRRQTDWQFSALLLTAMLAMVSFGYVDWYYRFHDTKGLLLDQANWNFANYGFDLMFDGLFQNMDSAMFSMIAFYILSAAYRAFRIRSIESTVLMTSALILMLSLMGALVYVWSHGFIDPMVRATHQEVLYNFKIETVAEWLKKTMQTPSLRAIEFGVGLGALAMGLRIWLGLERGGVSA